MADTAREPYGLAIGRLVDDYRDFTIGGGPGGYGYTARMRHRGGHGHVGTLITGMDCDALAEAMDAARAAVIRAAPAP